MISIINRTKKLSISGIFDSLSRNRGPGHSQCRDAVLLAALFCLCQVQIGCFSASGPAGSSRQSNDFSKRSQSVNEGAGIPDQAAENSDNTLNSKEIMANAASVPLADWGNLFAKARSRPADISDARFKLMQVIDDGKYVLSLTENGEVKLWDIHKNIGYFVCETGRSFRTAALELSRGLIAVAQTGSLELYSIASCERIGQMKRIKSRISALKFHPDGLSVLAAGIDGRLYRWRFALDKTAKSFRRQQLSLERYFGHATSVSSVAAHPTGRVFFSGDLNGVIHAWLAYDADKFQGKYDQSFFGFQGHSERALRAVGQLEKPDRVESLHVSDSGEHLLVASQDGTVELWKVRGFVRVASVKAHAGLIYDLSVFKNESGELAFFTLGRDGFVRLWNVIEDPLLKTTALKQMREFKLSDGRMLAGVSEQALLAGTRQGKLLEVQLLAVK